MGKKGLNSLLVVGALVVLTLAGNLSCRRGPQPSPELQSLLEAEILDRQVGDAELRDATTWSSAADRELLLQRYQDLFRQSERAAQVRMDLETSYPKIPVRALLRRFPPPVGLEALRAMGRDLCGGP